MAGLEGVQAFPIQVDGSDLNIGIVVAQFNQDIGEAMLDACYSELIRIGVSTENVAIASVPGALEVPLTLQRFADSGRFEALIALGAVIRGDTYHFEIVSNESAAGLTTGTISVSCNPRARVTVTIGTSPNSGGFNPRQMKQIAGVDLLNYNLYRDPGRVEIWGDGTGGTFSQWKNVNRNKPRVFSVYGRIPPLQNVSAGPYTDILVVTITF